MPMPETAMNEYHGLVLGENQIRFPGEIFDMQAVAETGSMESFAENKLGLGIFAPDAGHHPAPGGFVDDIGHC